MAAGPTDGERPGLLDRPGAAQAIAELCNEVNLGLDYALPVDWTGENPGQFFTDAVAHYLDQRNVAVDPDYERGQHRERRRPGEPGFRTVGADVAAVEVDDPTTTVPFGRVTDRAFGLPHDLLVFVYSEDDGGLDTVTGGPGDASAGLPTVERCFFVPRDRAADVRASRAISEAVREVVEHASTREEVEVGLRERLDDLVFGGAPTAAELSGLAADRRPPDEGVLAVRPQFEWRVGFAPYLGRSRDPDGKPKTEARNEVDDIYPP